MSQATLNPGNANYVDGIRKALPGLILVAALGVFAFWADGYIKENYKELRDMILLNYVLIAIISGMIIRNAIGIPAVLEPGLRFSTVFTKSGIVVMGTKYTLISLIEVGATSMLFIAAFLFGTVALLFWLRKYFTMSDSLAATLAAGFSVCGVSAAVATGPAVRAKTGEIAYTIASILIFGLLALFTLPYIGLAIGLTPDQFGAWAGVAILNSAQVLAAGFAFHEEAGLMAGIFNMGRVVLLPFVVLMVIMLVLGRESSEVKGINKTQFILDKFPIFVVAFLIGVMLNTVGVFSKEELKLADTTMIWAFCFGFASIGLNTRFKDFKAAGKDGIILGFVVALVKAALALAVVLWFLPL